VSLIPAWVLFPLLLAAIGAGWGVLVERAAGAQVNDVLLLPLGLAAVLIVAGTLTTFSATAPAAVPVAAVGAAAGLALLVWSRLHDRASPAAGRGLDSERQPGPRRSPLPGRWPLLAAVGALLAYGAPVLLSGQATFTGIIKLDDTATWFNVVDVVMSHSHSLTALQAAFHPPSTFTQVFTGDVGEHYPLGAFMLLGVGNGLTGIDPAWIIQPYFACCAAALALCVYALVEPLVPSPRLRALVAFLAAQPALLYGYSLWGGIKEMTAAFVLALGIALAVPLLRRPPVRLRDLRAMVPLAVAAGAIIQTLQVGGGGWAGPALLLLAVAWLLQAPRLSRLRVRLTSLLGLAAMTAALILPVWVALQSFLTNGYSGLFTEGQTVAEKFGNLVQPISGWQLAGIWPAGDFRFTAPAMPTVLFIAVALIAAAGGLGLGVRRRQFGPALYVAVVLLACGLVYFTGATPWVLGKSLAISSPALLTAALTGAAMLWSSRRAQLPRLAGGAQAGPEEARAYPQQAVGDPAERHASWVAWSLRHGWVLGPLVMLVLAGGVLWSNVLAYSDATLAPRARLVELQHVGRLLAGKGPTFINEFEAYADRHFLRAGAPVGPAEYRPVTLPLRSGAILTKAAWANLDAFPLSTLLPYRSIVTRRSPVESRPPSVYTLAWQGHYYQLWQRPEPAPTTILEHIPYGEPNTRPYCGAAQFGPNLPLCPINPVAIPACSQLLGFARTARKQHADLLAYQRATPTFARGDDVLWPGTWIHDAAGRSLQPTNPGTAVGHVAIPSSQRYELFLGGGFDRGFEVRVDGAKVGTVKDQLAGFSSFVPVADVFLNSGVHTFEYTYPQADLTPGNGETLGTGEFAADARFTSLSAIVLQPLQYPPTELISVAPAEARRLCGRPLEWVELVSRGASGS
jgi:hypothetical protein